MPFHTYAKPADYVVCHPTARKGLFTDASLTSGAVRFKLGYTGGPIEDSFNRLDTTTGLDRHTVEVGSYDAADPDHLYTWSLFPGGSTWGITSGKAYNSSGYAETALIVSHDNVTTGIPNRLNGDFQVDVSATVRAGLCRVASDHRYLYCNLDIAAGRVKVVDEGGAGLLMTGTTVITSGTTYTLRLTNTGSTYTVYLNGVSQGTFVDTYYSAQPLRAGIYAHTDTAARFENFKIQKASNPVPTTYTVRNYAGNVIKTGSITSEYLDIADSDLTIDGVAGHKYGWYRVYLTGVNHGDGQWGTAYGDCTFLRLADYAATLANDPTVFSEPVAITEQGIDEIARGVMALGTTRYAILDINAAPATSIAYLQPAVARHKTWWNDNADAVRDRKTIVAFPNGAGSNPTNTTAIVNGLKAYVKVWETTNEPNYTYGHAYNFINNDLIAFYNAVKAADSTAIVSAPANVSFGNYFISPWAGPPAVANASLDGIWFFLEFLVNGGDAYCDAYSLHPYNCYPGDLPAIRFSLGCLLNAIDRYGTPAKDIRQTEQGQAHAFEGFYWPKRAARWTALQVFMQEVVTMGRMRLENNFYWYDSTIGFDSASNYWIAAAGPGPQTAAIRTQAGECRGKTITAELDFGYPGMMMYCGGVWTNATTGDKVLGVIGGSFGMNDIRFAVIGASSFVRVDSWGNQMTLTAVGGYVTFPVSELGCWLRVPAGTAAALVPSDWNWGTNATYGGTPNTNSPTADTTYFNLAQMNNAPATYVPPVTGSFSPSSYSGWPNWYPMGGVGGTGSANQPFIDASTVYPQLAWVTFSSRPLNRFILWCEAPWHDLGTVTDFDMQTFDGSTWTTRQTWTTTDFKSFAYAGADRCTYETYWDDQYIFEHKAASPITCQGVRLYVRANSFGGMGNFEINQQQSGQGGWGYWLFVRELQAYNITDVTTPVRPAVRTVRRRFSG